jgi:hypothetical protein
MARKRWQLRFVTMTKTARILLIVSLVTIAFSLTTPGGELCYGLLKPAGALLFMVFYLVNLMAKEMALYDEENSMRHRRATHRRERDTKPSVSGPLSGPSDDKENPTLLTSDKDSVRRHAFAE